MKVLLAEGEEIDVKRFVQVLAEVVRLADKKGFRLMLKGDHPLVPAHIQVYQGEMQRAPISLDESGLNSLRLFLVRQADVM